MKKRLILVTAFVAVAALAIVPFVYAAPGRHMRGHGQGFSRGDGGLGLGMLSHVGKIKEELNLTDQQSDALKTIFRDLREQNMQLRGNVRDGFKGVIEKLIANPNDLAGAQAMLDQQEANERIMKSNALTATSKALNVLTPEQRTKLGSLLAEHGERRERRKQ